MSPLRFLTAACSSSSSSRACLFATSGANSSYCGLLLRRLATFSSSFTVEQQQQQQQQQEEEQQSSNTRRVVLDFNEIRLIGRVDKVLDLSTKWATFVLSTERRFRHRQSPSPQAADSAGNNPGPAVAFRIERVAHLVQGPVGSNSSYSDSVDASTYLYPGSRLEVVGQMTYRPERRAAFRASDAAPDQTGVDRPAAASKFVPIVRIKKLLPVTGASATEPSQQRQQQQQQQRQAWRRREIRDDSDRDELPNTSGIVGGVRRGGGGRRQASAASSDDDWYREEEK